MKYAKIIICKSVLSNTRSGWSVFGIVSGDVIQILSDDPKKAEIAGWQLIGQIVFTEKSCYINSDTFSKRKITKIIDHYDELICRTSYLTDKKLKNKHVAFIGVGASINLIKSCTRSGVDEFSLWDLDIVELPNIGRTAYDLTDLSLNKTRAAHKHILNINPSAVVHEYHGDFLSIPEQTLKAQLESCDVIVMGTDNQKVQLRGNELGYSLNKKMIFPGFYKEAAGGEIVIVTPSKPCYKCQVSSRFEDGDNDDLSAESGLIFDCDHLDSIAGKLIITALLEDSNPKYKKFFDHASNHSLIFSKHDPDFTLEGQDLFGEYFGNDGHAYAYETLWINPSHWRNPDCKVCG